MAFFLAVSTALSLTATVYAEDESEPRETVRVGQFDCWVVDGEYYTEYDGEVCQVINLDEITPQCVDFTQSTASNPTSVPTGGPVDLSDGKTYKGDIDISTGNDSTPIFLGKPQSSDYAYKLTAKFVFKNTYSIEINTYDSLTKSWNSYTTSVTFSALSQSKLISCGTMNNKYITGCSIKFYRTGSSGESVFNYWISQS